MHSSLLQECILMGFWVPSYGRKHINVTCASQKCWRLAWGKSVFYFGWTVYFQMPFWRQMCWKMGLSQRGPSICLGKSTLDFIENALWSDLKQHPCNFLWAEKNTTFMPCSHLALCNRLQIALKSWQNAQCVFGCHLFLMVSLTQCDFAAPSS